MTRYPVIRFLQSPLGRFLERVLYRFGPWKRVTSRMVWAEIGHSEFGARIERALRERCDPLDVIEW